MCTSSSLPRLRGRSSWAAPASWAEGSSHRIVRPERDSRAASRLEHVERPLPRQLRSPSRARLRPPSWRCSGRSRTARRSRSSPSTTNSRRRGRGVRFLNVSRPFLIGCSTPGRSPLASVRPPRLHLEAGGVARHREGPLSPRTAAPPRFWDLRSGYGRVHGRRLERAWRKEVRVNGRKPIPSRFVRSRFQDVCRSRRIRRSSSPRG